MRRTEFILSRLVDRSEIVDTHDYNLNTRRYVDETPDPDPEDIQAHLIGGIPEAEVATLQDDFDRFGIHCDSLFQAERTGYLAFREEISDKAAIKQTLEADAALQQTRARHDEAIESWWMITRGDFARLRDGKKMPEVRQELLNTLKDKLMSLSGSPRPASGRRAGGEGLN